MDNVENDEYLYILTVYTGLHRHAGTKSNVCFIIIDGEDPYPYSDVRRLDDEHHQVCSNVRGFFTNTKQNYYISGENLHW